MNFNYTFSLFMLYYIQQLTGGILYDSKQITYRENSIP